MPTDLETKNFETSLKKLAARWASKIKQPLRDLERVQAALDALAKQRDLGPDDQKKQKQLLAHRKKLQLEVEKATNEYRLEVLIVTPPATATRTSLTKLVEPILEKVRRGLPLSKGWKLVPKVDVDVKKRKLKRFELQLKWAF